MIHTVKDYGIISKAEVDDFLELSSFFHDPTNVGNLISSSPAFSRSKLNFWKINGLCWRFKVEVEGLSWSLTWRILSITLLACEMSAIVQSFKCSLALCLFGIGMETDLFQFCGHCWVFQICWHVECSIFTASSFRIWNSLTGISSPLLALFIVILPKAHLTLHSRCLVLGEWSYHHDYLGREDFFCIVLMCILATS